MRFFLQNKAARLAKCRSVKMEVSFFAIHENHSSIVLFEIVSTFKPLMNSCKFN